MSYKVKITDENGNPVEFERMTIVKSQEGHGGPKKTEIRVELSQVFGVQHVHRVKRDAGFFFSERCTKTLDATGLDAYGLFKQVRFLESRFPTHKIKIINYEQFDEHIQRYCERVNSRIL